MIRFRELVSFEASLYSVPARRIRAGQRLELRVTGDLVAIHAPAEGDLLAVHRRAAVRGTWVVDEAHWDGLPDGRTRATTVELANPRAAAGHAGATSGSGAPPNPLTALLSANAAVATPVAHRPLTDYAAAALTAPDQTDRS